MELAQTLSALVPWDLEDKTATHLCVALQIKRAHKEHCGPQTQNALAIQGSQDQTATFVQQTLPAQSQQADFLLRLGALSLATLETQSGKHPSLIAV
jgi:hypothetical protein